MNEFIAFSMSRGQRLRQDIMDYPPIVVSLFLDGTMKQAMAEVAAWAERMDEMMERRRGRLAPDGIAPLRTGDPEFDRIEEMLARGEIPPEWNQ